MNKYAIVSIIAVLVIAGGIYYVEENGYKPGVTENQTATTTDKTASTTTMDAIGVTEDGKEIPVKVEVNPTVSLTMADNNTTVRIKKGTTVVLALGEEVWTLTLKPEGIFEQIKNVGAIPGVQGIYSAKKVGTVSITGEGRPKCAPGAMCAQYIVNFATKVAVEN